MTAQQRAELVRLAKIDYREPHREITEDTFCDSDEWAERSTTRWLNWLAETVENQTPNRRKEK